MAVYRGKTILDIVIYGPNKDFAETKWEVAVDRLKNLGVDVIEKVELELEEESSD